MRVVLAAANPFFAEPIARDLAATGMLVALVRPARRFERARRLFRYALRAPDPLERLARSAGLPIASADRNATRLAGILERFHTDVFLMATFPFVVGSVPLAVPRLASLNIHPSLLPRHRGPNPQFWLYHRDDRTAGVSIHAVTSRVDAGPVLARSEVPLGRGHPVTRLQDDLSRLSVPMLRSVLGDLDAGTAEMEPQDERLATAAPRVAPSARMVDFASWPAERVWHFLKGLFPKYRELLYDGRGASVVYAGVGAWRREEHASDPGTVTPTNGGWLLWCTDGCVELHESQGRGRHARVEHSSDTA